MPIPIVHLGQLRFMAGFTSAKLCNLKYINTYNIKTYLDSFYLRLRSQTRHRSGLLPA